MRRWFGVLACLGAGFVASIGCADSKPKRALIRPPKEDFHHPPDGLFTGPVKYPDDVLNNVKPRGPKDDKGPPGGWDAMPTGGGGGSMMGGNMMGGAPH
jgi:hypothetical protein